MQPDVPAPVSENRMSARREYCHDIASLEEAGVRLNEGK
jgi:hypothetical protein